MSVDGARLWESVEALGRIGATAAGGVTRIALTETDRTARRLVERWARDAGCELRIDAVGNCFARLPGTSDGPAVMIGSHLDSQPDGGRFDGALGVLCALEVVRALSEADAPPRHPVELAVWTDEEGARFDVSCIGSSVFAGQMPLEDAYALRDRAGVSLEEALDAVDLRGSAQVGSPLPAAYFELHIEQGPVLEALDVPIGVVEGIPGIRWHELRFTGAAGHAGATTYEARRDALLPAAKAIQAIDAIGRGRPPHGRGTTCTVDVEPNAGSVIPSGVRLLTDLRHMDAIQLDAMEDAMREGVRRAGDEGGVATSIDLVWAQGAIEFDPVVRELIAAAAERAGVAWHSMPSGAGHDAGPLASVVPTGMIFVPCEGGVSHHADESVRPEHAETGAEVLLEAVQGWMAAHG